MFPRGCMNVEPNQTSRLHNRRTLRLYAQTSRTEPERGNASTAGALAAGGCTMWVKTRKSAVRRLHMRLAAHACGQACAVKRSHAWSTFTGGQTKAVRQSLSAAFDCVCSVQILISKANPLLGGFRVRKPAPQTLCSNGCSSHVMLPIGRPCRAI